MGLIWLIRSNDTYAFVLRAKVGDLLHRAVRSYHHSRHPGGRPILLWPLIDRVSLSIGVANVILSFKEPRWHLGGLDGHYLQYGMPQMRFHSVAKVCMDLTLSIREGGACARSQGVMAWGWITWYVCTIFHGDAKERPILLWSSIDRVLLSEMGSTPGDQVDLAGNFHVLSFAERSPCGNGPLMHVATEQK